jgi:gamma-glutamylcyclotransferase (GGCT)/AIG2-like uncharacterized protein YtfP
MDDEVEDESATSRRATSMWLRPGGISAIAGVAAVIVSVIGILIAIRPDATAAPAPTSSDPGAERPAMFVYGSSMPGQSRHAEIEQYVVEVDKDSVEGTLYDSGLGYPMAKFGPGEPIPGYVLWLDPETADDVFREQTRLEAGLYHPVTVRTANGVTATAYEWIGETDGFPRIDEWDGSTAGYGAYVQTATLVPGECYMLSTYLDEVITQWCDAPHSFEVYFSDTVAEAADEKRADERCRDEFDVFVGVPADESALAVEVIRPPADPERLVCALYEPGALLTGTMAGAAR